MTRAHRATPTPGFAAADPRFLPQLTAHGDPCRRRGGPAGVPAPARRVRTGRSRCRSCTKPSSPSTPTTRTATCIEITRALRPVTPQEDLDAQLTIEALLRGHGRPGTLDEQAADPQGRAHRRARRGLGAQPPRVARGREGDGLTMPRFYVLEIPENEGVIAVAARDSGRTRSTTSARTCEITAASPIVIDRRATGCRHAVWYSAVAALARDSVSPSTTRTPCGWRHDDRPPQRGSARAGYIAAGGRIPDTTVTTGPRAHHARQSDRQRAAARRTRGHHRRVPDAPAPGLHPPRARPRAAQARIRGLDPGHPLASTTT